MENLEAIKGLAFASYTIDDIDIFFDRMAQTAVKTFDTGNPDEEFFVFSDGSMIRRVQDVIFLFDYDSIKNSFN